MDTSKSTKLTPWHLIKRKKITKIRNPSYTEHASSLKENKIKSMTKYTLLLILLFSFFSIGASLANPNYQNFLRCLINNTQHYSVGSSEIIVYTPSTSNYTSFYLSSVRNLRFLRPVNRKPFLIITPTDVLHVQASVVCAKENGVWIRVRSGGHDYEGQSYRAVDDTNPFVIIDLVNLHEIEVDVDQGTAWVQAGDVNVLKFSWVETEKIFNRENAKIISVFVISSRGYKFGYKN